MKGIRPNCLRVGAALTLLLSPFMSAVGENPSASAARFQDFQPLARRFCIECHNAEKTEGEVDIDKAFQPGSRAAEDHELLASLLRVIEEREMPPRKAKTKPTETERSQMTALLKTALEELRLRQKDDPGVVLITRLNRTEYRNVLRDLSGGVVTRAGEYLPNEGGAGEGFANVGEAQGMSAAQFERYLEAAKGALRHLRMFPNDGLVWSAVPRDAVDDPAAARKEVVDDIIAWHIAQQQKWGEQHREELQQKLGFNHAAYLEASWRYHHRAALKQPEATFADIARTYDVPLAPIVLEKWFGILSAEQPSGVFAEWAKAWQVLPADANATEIRRRCVEIVSGKAGVAPVVKGDFAPTYEISFHEAKEEVLAAAKEGYWPFRIEIGDAKELYFVVTDAGDGARGEFATWRKGRFQFADGTAKPWQEVTKVVGANSGREFPFGRHAKDGRALPPDSIGVQPPGALKIAVPPSATLFELELALDPESVGKASVQALVLREKPKSQSYIAGRPVFGGKPATNPQAKAEAQSKELDRALRKRNVAEANLTKIGLNAERNVFAGWARTPVESIGGPWPGQIADKEEPQFPYHLTVEQVRRNATAGDLAVLHQLEGRLAALTRPADPAKALEWLVSFARRAWRGSVGEAETAMLAGLYREAAASGASFDSAMKTPLLAVLMSPQFLYRGAGTAAAEDNQAAGQSDLEKAPSLDVSLSPPPIVPLPSHELSTRLSFFLWASIPDYELLALAETDKLREPEALRAQARRMLRDPRARSLVTDFAAQLWDFAGFETFTGPDAKRFPQFTPAARQKMLDDLVSALCEVFQEGRPLTELLGENGLATQPVFLTKTSLPLRTSPVQRGVWILEKVLGRHLPNPPANVPPLSEDDKDSAGLNIRQQLERHRADPSCASCHDKIDPLGIALENYDPIGRWRDTERDGSPLANTATTHDGVELRGPNGLKKYLHDRQSEVFAHFNRKLLGYALGRAVLPGDAALLEKLNTGLPQNGHRFSFLVESIVSSPQFTRKVAATSVAAHSPSPAQP